MNTTSETTPESADSKVPKPSALIVSSIKPPQLLPILDESQEGNHRYYITYVQVDGTQVTARCSQAVSDWMMNQKPWFDCRTEWILSVARSANAQDENGKPLVLVVDVVRKPEFRKEMSPGALNMDNLVLLKAGNTYEPLNLPHRFDPETLDEVVSALEKAGTVRQGNTVGNRFIVRQVILDGDSCYVGVDLKA